MLFSFAKSSIIARRAQRPRRDTDLDKFSQALKGSRPTSDEIQTHKMFKGTLFTVSELVWSSGKALGW